MTPPRSVLAARFSAMGDVAMTINALYPLAQANPAVRFTLLTKAPLEGLFVNAPENLRVIGLKFKGTPWADARTLLRVLGEVRPQAFVDLHDVLRSRLLGALCRLKGVVVRRFDKSRAAKRRLVRRGAQRAQAVTPTVERYMRAFDGLGLAVPPVGRATVFPSGAPDASLLAKVKEKVGLPAAGLRHIGIAPYARHAAKTYPADMLAELVERLTCEAGVHVWLFGGKGEAASLTALAAGRPNVTVTAGASLGFDGEMALMHYMDAMLTMDSANMHLANLTGTRVVSVWGATHPAAGFMLPGVPERDVLQVSTLACRPCSVFGDKPCRRGDAACMRGVSAATVARALLARD